MSHYEFVFNEIQSQLYQIIFLSNNECCNNKSINHSGFKKQHDFLMTMKPHYTWNTIINYTF